MRFGAQVGAQISVPSIIGKKNLEKQKKNKKESLSK